MGFWFRRGRRRSSSWGRKAVFAPGTCSVRHRSRGAARRCRNGCADAVEVDTAQIQAQAQMALSRATADLARSQATKALAAEW